MSFVLPYTKELVMNQRSLDRAVAEATGESVDTIRHLGFWLVEAASSDLSPSDPDWNISVIDWDGLEAQRLAWATDLGCASDGGAHEL
jgi:hypothetical protein